MAHDLFAEVFGCWSALEHLKDLLHVYTRFLNNNMATAITTRRPDQKIKIGKIGLGRSLSLGFLTGNSGQQALAE